MPSSSPEPGQAPPAGGGPKSGAESGRRFGPYNAHRRRPPWWPENEPWPPAHWNPRRWIWRVGLLFLVLFILVFAFGAAVAWIGQSWIAGDQPPSIDPPWMMWRNMPSSWILPRILFGGVVVFLFGLGFVTVVRNLVRSARPVDEVMRAAQRVAQGDYSVRVAEAGAKETRALAHTFNVMTTQLESNDLQRRRLLADVTHELRTPLTVIQGELEAVLDGVHPADPAHLSAILDETHVMGRLIDDLRTLALAESGALRLMREPVDLGVLASEAVAAFQARAASAGVSLTVEAPPDVPLADLDPLRLREVLTNLIANALRYTPSGGKITVAIEATAADQLAVSVRDTGAGIPPERLEHIFDRFYKSDESRGSGLGLAIVKSLVESHGGTLGVSSKPGEGTTFRFTLPI